MRFKLLLILVLLGCVTTSYASFPVERNVNNVENTITVQNADSGENFTSPAAVASDEKWIAAALWFVAWPLAAHRWYLRWSTGWNILFILTLGGLGIWALVDIINILTDNY